MYIYLYICVNLDSFDSTWNERRMSKQCQSLLLCSVSHKDLPRYSWSLFTLFRQGRIFCWSVTDFIIGRPRPITFGWYFYSFISTDSYSNEAEWVCRFFSVHWGWQSRCFGCDDGSTFVFRDKPWGKYQWSFWILWLPLAAGHSFCWVDAGFFSQLDPLSFGLGYRLCVRNNTHCHDASESKNPKWRNQGSVFKCSKDLFGVWGGQFLLGNCDIQQKLCLSSIRIRFDGIPPSDFCSHANWIHVVFRRTRT